MPELSEWSDRWSSLRERLAGHWPVLPGLVLGAILRFWHLLPAFLYGDEAEYAIVARTLAHNGLALAYPALEGFGPTPFVSQPPLLLYLDAAAGSVAHSYVAGPLLVSALLGTATIAVVYAIGAVLRDRWMGGLAGFFLAALPFHVALSRSAQLDAGFTFLFTLTLLMFLLWLRDPRPRWALATGCAVAATTFAKLPGILVLVPILAVLGARAVGDALRRDDRLRGPAARARLALTWRHLLVAALPVAAAAVVYLTQLWILHGTGDLFAKLGWNAGRVAGQSAGTIPRDWSWYFTSDVGLWMQWGFGLVFLAAAGSVLVLVESTRDRRQRWAHLALLAWPLAMLAFLLASSRKEWFYAMPLSPTLVLLAAWSVHATAKWAWAASKPLPGQAWWQTPGAIIAVVGLTVIAGIAPLKLTLERKIGGQDTDYGAGLREAATWIHEQDPQAAQVGTTLGRFSLSFYNGQPTYHYFVNHTWLDGQADSGAVRYVVRDPYLNLTYELSWLDSYVARHNGTLVQHFDSHGRSVEVFRLNATKPS